MALTNKKGISYDSGGERVNLAPFPILVRDWEVKLGVGMRKGLAAALAQQELGRMHRIYERFGAWMVPTGKASDGRTQWAVVFPKGAPWKSGPRVASAWKAKRLNYELNKRFPGYDTAAMDRYSLENINAAVDQDRREAAQRKREVLDEIADRFKG